MLLHCTRLLREPGEIMPPTCMGVPVFKGTIFQANVHLGGVVITVNGDAPALPSGRSALGFDSPKNNAFSECDLILDLSGGQPLFAAAEKRDGYFRPDPGGGDRTSTRLNSSH